MSSWPLPIENIIARGTGTRITSFGRTVVGCSVLDEDVATLGVPIPKLLAQRVHHITVRRLNGNEGFVARALDFLAGVHLENDILLHRRGTAAAIH